MEVHHVPQGLNVDASGRDVRGDQNSEATGFEACQGLGALGLRPVAMDSLGVNAIAVQELGQAICLVTALQAHRGSL